MIIRGHAEAVGAHAERGRDELTISIRSSIDFFDGCLKHDQTALARLANDVNVQGKARLQSS